MDSTLLNVAIVVGVLIAVGIALTAYEFREHIIQRFRHKKHKH